MPSSSEQSAYFVTGALAGLAALPIELGPSARLLPVLKSHLAIQVPRAGFRFWVFDLSKSQLSSQLPGTGLLRTTLVGALSGFSGGLAEVTYQSLVFRRHLPEFAALASQSGKLFFCFGTYTFLSTSLSEELPPRPFWYCWVMGAVAGAVGSGVLAAVEGARGSVLAKLTGKGALSIGTVIAVQVTTCAKTLMPAKA
ncbi:uncharacterized protein K452DRAFT_289075 [Aplosporella prunicola CBS 121167]|uniref:Uncharacterized protein n=1 Tax=Aplosporella prunicola CBS 121167 TaxID=1176127 RepID=A0A6A6B801_9PEZI|nr:uncharacterized protein K452DRAFT_289075 [Aplosporella prunicola CBS 121167]KAF2140332.1 hypothetical protein K452DRAFT_289075 [Aplosporella prunicola CBS 121167]